MANTPQQSSLDEQERDTLPGAPRSEGVPTGVYVSPALTGDEETPTGGARVVEERSERVAMQGSHEPSWGDVLLGVARNVDAVIRREVTAHPYRSLAIAAAAGFAIRNAKAARVVALLGSRVALDALTTSAANSAV